MKRKRACNLNHFQILNVPSTANKEALAQAYLTLTSIYGDASIATYGALDEEENKWMISRIQDAYDTLIDPQKREEYLNGLDDFAEIIDIPVYKKSLYIQEMNDYLNANSLSNGQNKGVHTTSDKIGSSRPPSATRITGAHLRNVRMAKGASLDEIAASTKIKKSFLEAFETENFNAFPAPVFMKGFLKTYAKALGLNPKEISDRYFDKD